MNLSFNIAFILFWATVVTGVLWAVDALFFARKRKKEAKAPLWAEYARDFFPVLLIVFVIRSFLFEPFRIPSGSMIPTLLVGDFILVNKFSYGLRLPVVNATLWDLGQPQRGDVVVFRYPHDPDVDYVKRVVGVPGDVVEIRDRRLYLNGKMVPLKYQSEWRDDSEDSLLLYEENLDTHPHPVLLRLNWQDPPYRVEVPPRHYFVMGDNRDNSSDSRVWGLVPEENLVGKATVVWLNLSRLDRVGKMVH